MVFNSLEIDEVNRAAKVVESAAGKSLNTARALSVLGTPALTAGFNGGVTGRALSAFLKAYGVTSAMTPMNADTRVCTTLIDRHSGAVTELVEEAPSPGRNAVVRFVRENLRRLREVSLLVISGTLPPFVGDDFYVGFVQEALKSGVPVVIDSQKAALINVLFERPWLAKLTVRELEATLNEPIKTERQILRGMKDLRGMGAQNVCVTQGGKAAYLLTPKQAWRFTPPVIACRQNPIGSGDCTTAGIASALLKGKGMKEAVIFGLACGSANVESLTPADLDLKRVRVLNRGVTCVAV
jgi:1-phosphofructokinase family hexose kinase